MSFRLVPKSVTLNDLERHNGGYIALFHCIWKTCVTTHNGVDLWLRVDPFPSNRQHLSYDVCLELRGEIIRTVLCCIVY